jgi:hypothetical protein
MKPPPSTHDDLSKWVIWTDEHYPYQSRTYDGPSELAILVGHEDREIAASAARVWFAMHEKRQPPAGAPVPIRVEQLGFDGETWER